MKSKVDPNQTVIYQVIRDSEGLISKDDRLKFISSMKCLFEPDVTEEEMEAFSKYGELWNTPNGINLKGWIIQLTGLDEKNHSLRTEKNGKFKIEDVKPKEEV